MSRPICPMLVALPATDAAGQTVNRECLQEPCRFYDRQHQDCGLSLQSAATARLVAQSELDGAEAHAAAARMDEMAGRITSLEARAAAIETAVGDLLGRIAALVESQQQALTAQQQAVETQQKAAERLLEEMSLLMTRTEKEEASIATLADRLQRSEESTRGILEALETRHRLDQADLDARRRDEAVLVNNRGVALYYRGAHEAARDAFVKALELQPEYAEAHNNLGLAYSRLGQSEQAVESFRRALSADPKMGEAYNNLGFLYHTTAQFDRAAQMFGLAIENAGSTSVAYANLGNTYYAMKQPEKAVEAWRHAVDLDPMNESAKRGLRMFEQDDAAAA